MAIAKNKNRLGTENVGKLLFTLAVPNILAQVINMLYNVVDRMFIGHLPEVGSVALTGVGIAFPIIILVAAFSALVGMGGGPLASIKMGEDDTEGAERILGISTVLLVILAIAITAIILLFGQPLLRLFGASEATLPFAWAYMRIYALGTIFVLLALGLTPFISAQGFAKESMISVLIGAVLNIILDPILMFGFNLGVTGAAIATIFSQAVSALYVVRFLTGSKTNLRIKKEHLRLSRPVILSIVSLGVSPFIMQSTESLLNIAFNTSLQRYGGDLNVGAMTIIASLMQALMLPLMGLTQGSQPIVSYNFGAKNLERVKTAFKWLFMASMIYALIFWAVMNFAPEILIQFFTKDPELIEITVKSINVYMGVVFVLGAQIPCQQTLLALGKAKPSLMLALLRKIILLIPLIYILPNFFDNKVFAVLLAEPVADFISVTVTVFVFRIIFRKLLATYRAQGVS